jgi:Lipocalin-like domain
MTTRSRILSMLALTLLLAACEKEEDDDDDDDDDDNKAPKTELLQDSKWMTIAHTETVTEDGEKETEDMYEEMEECEKDNIIWFKKTGETVSDQGTLKCAEDEPQSVITGTWKLTTDGKHIEMTDEDNDTETVEILELTSTRLKVTSSYTEDGAKYENELTFKRMN